MGATNLRGQPSHIKRALQAQSGGNFELYSLEMPVGSCSNRNMFLLTGIFTEHHVLAAHVAAFKIAQLTNEAFIPYYSATVSSISSSVFGFLMLGVVIGVAIAMALYKVGVVNVRMATQDEYGKLNMDSTHSVASPIAFRGLLSDSPPSSPEDGIQMNTYGGLPSDSEIPMKESLDLESKSDVSIADFSKMTPVFPLPTAHIQETFPLEAQASASGSADSSDEMIPARARFSAKVLQ